MNRASTPNRFAYYTRQAARLLVPPPWLRGPGFPNLHAPPSPEVAERAAYYLRLDNPFPLSPDAAPFRLNLLGKRTAYQLDFWEVLRFFPPSLRVETLFGDNTLEPPTPRFVKSRPVSNAPSNAILLNLNRVRHFCFVKDPLPFRHKCDRLVWRGNAAQPQRRAFLARYFAHPRCDVGHFHRRPLADMPWQRGPLTLHEQLRHKFILSIEGNDVATSLKWILSSNSLCLMTRCRYETWFMEGLLQPGIHFALLDDDYGNLEETLDHYLAQPEEAEAIIHNANQWVAQFLNPSRESEIACRVVHRYFQLSGQLPA